MDKYLLEDGEENELPKEVGYGQGYHLMAPTIKLPDG